MFNKIISRMGEPVARTEEPTDTEPPDTLHIVAKFLRIIYCLCKRINADDLDDSKARNELVSLAAPPFKY